MMDLYACLKCSMPPYLIMQHVKLHHFGGLGMSDWSPRLQARIACVFNPKDLLANNLTVCDMR